MANRYVLGNTVVLTWTATKLTDAFGPTYTPYDVALPTFILEDPAGVKTTYTYPASAQITKATGVGRYVATFKPTAIGTWKYQWLDPDATTPGLIEGSFSVSATKI